MSNDYLKLIEMIQQYRKDNKLGQRQDSMTDQLADLLHFANALGMYDAADYLKKFQK